MKSLHVGLAVALLFASSAGAQQAETWAGAWRSNLMKSSYPEAPPFKRITCRIEPRDTGWKVVYDVVRLRGGILHLEWIGKPDGRDYPVQGVDFVMTNAYTRVDDRRYDVVIKLEGQVTGTARIVLSPDGRTMTTETTARSPQGQEVKTTTVFDRQ